ncbi:hypothetical protein [Phocaeicola barnesiae]|uniref:hypothetical protein n=1 Tax=Phocaeicola barnesiae TaxID=376804 RepID=UPI00033D1852|nr:hypothetical protein [Phocaeicola barnesiae]CDD33107.1 putative uncharacterized protein [Bacteroides sp. CAG:714]
MKNIILYVEILACIALLTACSKEELSSGSVDAIAGEVQFYGAIKKQSDILATTRATDEYITLNETGQDFGTFYIWMKVGSDNSFKSFFQPYKEAPGEQGNLVIDSEKQTDETERLNWCDETSYHTFYAWTQPSVKTGENDEITGGVKMNKTFQYGEQSSADLSGTVIYGTNKETDLEKFIITQKGPISYDEWGQDVALYFERPIAKITLEGITYIKSDGTFNENIKEATIQFPNMYSQATFTPLVDGIQNVLTGVPATKWITWNWDKEDDDSKSLYVHPFVLGLSSSDDKVDIQNDEGFFIVTVNVADPGSPEVNHSYVGTLNSLKLSSSSTSTERQKLNAGQCMRLYLIVRDGAGVGGGYKIVDWNEKGEQTLPQYRIPGVYNEEDAKRLLEALTNNTFPKGVEDLLVDNEINLFTHVDWSKVTTAINIPDDYTLKGNGYNVTLGENGSITGQQKNIYINGEYVEDSTSSNTGGEDSQP